MPARSTALTCATESKTSSVRSHISLNRLIVIHSSSNSGHGRRTGTRLRGQFHQRRRDPLLFCRSLLCRSEGGQDAPHPHEDGRHSIGQRSPQKTNPVDPAEDELICFSMSAHNGQSRTRSIILCSVRCFIKSTPDGCFSCWKLGKARANLVTCANR